MSEHTPLHPDWPVVILDDFDDVCARSPAVEALQRDFPVTVHRQHLEGTARQSALRQARIVVALRERSAIDQRFLEAAPKLELLAQTGTGLNHVDVPRVHERGIAIATTPGGSVDAVAELVIGLMLAFDHRIVAGNRSVASGDWASQLGREASGQTLGLVGFGAIARAVAPRAQALGMQVKAWGRSLEPAQARQFDVEAMPSVEALLEAADVVSLHLRLTPETRGFLDARRIAAIRSGALLVNTARGALLDQHALLDALQAGRLRGAALDVTDPEPLPAGHPLLSREDVLITPHMGWTTRGTYERFLSDVGDNIRAFVDGQPRRLVDG
ncbi:NAD(P)-dependent oxidoreductase [Halomonas sp. HP20-15]|uniref:NAD(P)-dependent oxidoreductase n=1 Tax=Halomonas sp. HP20-15 TaxID=3085901 RepID=UPI002982498C|nr:NAD(P)-dependent oxidoreductase [Halomonas sp. HP20-15]MDW5377387.1 NAD(P)-dependent oxidoreductase [Halomonas sp. HP20-15]